MGDTARGLSTTELYSVTPAAVSVDDRTITVTGANFFQSSTTGSMRVEACGVTTTATLVEPMTQVVLLPPAGKLTVEAGDRLTAELPSDGYTSGPSDVRVVRPDGSSATLENAITCETSTDPNDDDPADPGDDEPAEPTLGSLSYTLSPDVPLVVTITGPEGYSETFTGGRSLEGLEPGEYTLTVTPAPHGIEQEHEGTTYDYTAMWEASDAPPVIEVEAGKETTTQIDLRAARGTLLLDATGLPEDAEPEDAFLNLERLQPDGSWAPVDLTEVDNAEVGVYRAVSHEEIDYFPCDRSNCYRSTYVRTAAGGIVTVSSNGLAPISEISLAYELEQGTLRVESTSLPEGLTPDYSVARFTDTSMGPFEPNPETLEPGYYQLSMRDVSMIFPQIHPDGSTVDIHLGYKATGTSFTLDSGEEYIYNAPYTLALGSLYITINGEPDIIANVRFRQVGDPHWTTLTAPGVQQIGVPPGIYEIEALHVPAEPGVHDGYRPVGGDIRYLIVDSFGINGIGNHTYYNIEYRAE